MFSGEEHLLNISTTGSSVLGVQIDSLSLAIEELSVIGLAIERVLEGHLFNLLLLGVVSSFLVIIKSFFFGLFGFGFSGINLFVCFLNQGSFDAISSGAINNRCLFDDLLFRGLSNNISLFDDLLCSGLRINSGCDDFLCNFGSSSFDRRVLELPELSHNVVSGIGLGSEDNGGDSEQKFHLE